MGFNDSWNPSRDIRSVVDILFLQKATRKTLYAHRWLGFYVPERIVKNDDLAQYMEIVILGFKSAQG